VRPLLPLLLLAGVALADPTGPLGGAGDAPSVVAAHPVFGPALAHRSPSTLAAERQLEESARELQRSGHGLHSSLSYRPSISWRGREWEDFDPADRHIDHTLTLSSQWRFDPQAIARAAIAHHRAGVTLHERINRDLREALSLHIDLQRAHIALTLAQDAAVNRGTTLGSAETVDLERMAADPEAPAPTTLLAARLEAERAEAAVARAARDLDAAERRAAQLGFDTHAGAAAHRDRFAPLALEGWRLLLPGSDPLQNPEVRRAALELELAEATAGRVRAAGILPDVRLELNRTLAEGRTSATLRLDEGRPTATLDLSLRRAARPSWSLVVSAVVRIGEGGEHDLARSEQGVADAATNLADALADAAWNLERARRTAIDAEEDVAFAERGLAIARANLRAGLDRWSASDRRDAPERDRADAALARFAIALERERDAFYRAWNRYLLEVERAWSAAGVLGGVLIPPP
jgi:hypothetical protein